MLQAKIIAGLGVGLLVAILVAAVFMYRGNSIKAEAQAKVYAGQLDTALKVNKENAAAFRRIAVTQEANDALQKQLNEQIVELNKTTAANLSQLRQLGVQNAEVKAYLTTRLPAAVSGLLNARQAGNASAIPVGPAAH